MEDETAKAILSCLRSIQDLLVKIEKNTSDMCDTLTIIELNTTKTDENDDV